MSKSYRKDLTGQRFGRLKVIEFEPTEDKFSHWRCKCDCGRGCNVVYGNLTSGNVKSCGCLRKEILESNSQELLAKNKKHNLSKTRLYRIWSAIKQRCHNQNTPQYSYYGKRGIIVCDIWRDDFEAFYNWAIENGYHENLTIDRIDNDGNYEPSNCRWVDMKTQNRNNRKNIIVKYDNKNMCLKDVAAAAGIKYEILLRRYHAGDRGERLFRPVRKQK